MRAPGFLCYELEGRRFVAYLPPRASGPLPAILFLHGRGECGTDGMRQTAVGLGSAIRWSHERWPALVLFPQKPRGEDYWTNEEAWLAGLLNWAESEFEIDAHRRTITGLSQGGHGTFELAGRLPWKFAAAAPICGWASTEGFEGALLDIPVWAHHGAKDEVVPPDRSEKAVAAINAAGGNARLTIHPEAGHNSWDPAYGDPELAEWLLAQTL
jgi:predicted peptidase